MRCRWRGDRVGLVVERDQAGHRAEDLVLRDAHAVVDVGEYRGHHEVALRARASGSSGALEAAAEQRRAFLRAELDVAAHLRQVRLADHRADDGLVVQRVADA